jgi:hypothetical protein
MSDNQKCSTCGGEHERNGLLTPCVAALAARVKALEAWRKQIGYEPTESDTADEDTGESELTPFPVKFAAAVAAIYKDPRADSFWVRQW